MFPSYSMMILVSCFLPYGMAGSIPIVKKCGIKEVINKMKE